LRSYLAASDALINCSSEIIREGKIVYSVYILMVFPLQQVSSSRFLESKLGLDKARDV
jgi:hypothetical protein